jgi:hypothetical protein
VERLQDHQPQGRGRAELAVTPDAAGVPAGRLDRGRREVGVEIRLDAGERA